jgi:hypothetical protein
MLLEELLRAALLVTDAVLHGMAVTELGCTSWIHRLHNQVLDHLLRRDLHHLSSSSLFRMLATGIEHLLEYFIICCASF